MSEVPNIHERLCFPCYNMVLFSFLPFLFLSPLCAEDLIQLLCDLAVWIWSSMWATALTGSWLRCSGGFTLRSLPLRLSGSPSKRWQHTQSSAPLRCKDTSCSIRQTRLAPSKTLQRWRIEDYTGNTDFCKTQTEQQASDLQNEGIFLWNVHLDKGLSHTGVIKSNLWKICEFFSIVIGLATTDALFIMFHLQ